MDSFLAQKAVQAALDARWREAIKLNKLILKENTKDIDALNRLARAHAEIGEFKQAKTLAERALRLDPFNSIAAKALNKWRGLKSGQALSSGPTAPDAFLEEPGKTKIVSLLYLGDAKILAKLDAADEVKLTPHSHRVSVLSSDGKYIGRLPDDLSARLRSLIKKGNSYQVFVKSTLPNDVKVFIREVKRGKLVGDIPSFPAEKIDYITYASPEIIRKRRPGPLDDDSPAENQSAQEESF